MHRTLCALLLALAACGGATGAPAPAPAPATTDVPPRRAILVSFDSFSESRAYATLDSARTPAIHAFFRESACAAHALPHFPSVTAPGHAAIWTGAYGDVNGVAANTQPQLPRDRHDIMQVSSGYLASALRAEPIWITVGASGRQVFAHHVTQAPAAPGYQAVTGERSAPMAEARARAEQVLAMPNVRVVNGYDGMLTGDTLITEAAAAPREASGWRNVDRLRSGVTPLEIAWLVGGDSVFALLHGGTRYDRISVAPERDVMHGVTARATPEERDWPHGRQLARHFSAPLRFRTDSGSFFLRVRLFELSPDGRTFALYQPRVYVVQANRPEVEAAYADAVQGWVGNGASRAYERGVLGRTLMDGGDGAAERRYLESQELLTLQFMRGSEWGWNVLGAELLADYFPLGDEIDHMWLGHVDRDTPHYDASVGVPLSELRMRAWAMLDIRLAHLRSLVARTPNAALFVSGDHGMRSSWRIFRPNAALREAGLLVLDTARGVDVSLTRAVAPGGYYVMVNRTAWRNGTVAPPEEQQVIDAAERALLAARTPEGEPIVTRIFRPSAGDTLGLGGPVGGDLYFETARGYRWSWDPSGAITEDAEVGAGHGYPSVAPDMYTVLCAYGPEIAPRRMHGVRIVSAAPTVSEWLGAPPPPHARGSSVFSELLGLPRATESGR